MKIKIVVDSTCDMPQELIDAYGIQVIPLYVIKDGKSYKDMIEITPAEIFEHVEKTGKNCSTAAVSVADYIDIFTEIRKEYDAVISFHISQSMSSCYQNAVIAAQEVDGVYPIDTMHLSSGMAQQAIFAAKLAQEGVDAQEIVDRVNAIREKCDTSFVINTLSYLAKGGRCSTVAALGANLLSLKPCIELKDGKMGVGKKYRGRIDRCIDQYIKERLDGCDDLEHDLVFITHTGHMPEGTVEHVRETLRGYGFQGIYECTAGSTISNHCGPGTLGILYRHK